MTDLVPGFYGKLPSHGDFVRRRLSGPFVGLWDSWLQSAIARSKEQLGADWLDIYLGSPLWRFIFAPGVCGPGMSAGVLMPSVDKAGRYFPLTMAINLPEPVNPLRLATEYDDWFGRAESILLSSLDDAVRFELDEFDRQVESCVLEFTSPPKLPAESRATNFPGQGKSWHVGIASVDHLGASLRHLHWMQLGKQFNPLSMWWTNGSEHVAPSALLSEGIPPADSYAAMLDGQWRTRQWPSVQLESVGRLTQPAIAAEHAVPAIPVEEKVLVPEPGRPAAALAAEQTSAPPQYQEIIPELDPEELISPLEDDDESFAGQQEPAPVPASVSAQEGLSEQDEAIVVEPPVQVQVDDAPAQAVPEIDPLQLIEDAQPSDTPLDPLEALGLSDPADDLGVSAVPDPDADAAASTDEFETPTLPNQASEGPPGEPSQPIEGTTVKPAAGGPVFYSASATYAGKENDFNEDALLERRDMALWAVADGGGGHWIGDVASQTVVSELETVTPAEGLSDLADDVRDKLLNAHRYLQNSLGLNSESSDDSGAAVAVFVAVKSMSACLSAGPVRIYRSRNGDLQQLTSDSGSQAGLVGHASELLLDRRFHEIEVGDWLLLCSRGLFEEIDDDDIAKVFSGTSPDDVCERLMSEALSRGVRGNVTIVVIYAASPEPATT